MGRRLGMLALAAVLATVPTRAEDWTTSDGKTYHQVKVMSHDDAYVTILDSDGGARVLLRTLGPDLQKRFAYDVAKAAACEAATTAADKHDHAVLVAQQTAAQAPPAPQAPVAPVVQPLSIPTPAPAPQSALLHGPSAPRKPAKPTVDVTANNMKIEEDEKALEDLEVDLRDAERDARKWNYHWDESGAMRSNTMGDSPRDRIQKFLKKKKELEDEIKDLKAQNAAAGQPNQ